MQLVTDAAMEDTINEDHVFTARAKGLPDRQVRDRHAARTAVLPVLSRLVVSLPYFLTGLAILEFAFGFAGGLGNLLFFSIRNQDTPTIVGIITVVGGIMVFARLALDISYAVLDPRIRYGQPT
jgi:peptide/nickel transport system permease protein